MGCRHRLSIALFAADVLYAIGWIMWALSPLPSIGAKSTVDAACNRVLGLGFGGLLFFILLYAAIITGRSSGYNPGGNRFQRTPPDPEPDGGGIYTGEFAPVDHPAIGHALYHQSQEGRERYAERHSETAIGRRGDEWAGGVRVPEVEPVRAHK